MRGVALSCLRVAHVASGQSSCSIPRSVRLVSCTKWADVLLPSPLPRWGRLAPEAGAGIADAGEPKITPGSLRLAPRL